MIKVRGRDVTLTGEHAEMIQRLADELKITPQKAFNQAMREAIKRWKAAEKASKKAEKKK